MKEDFYLNLFKNKKLTQLLDKKNIFYKKKKILLYGAGQIFDALVEQNVLTSLNIIAVADQKFPKGVETPYKSFTGINGEDIKKYNPDIIIVSLLVNNGSKLVKYLKEDVCSKTENAPLIIPLFSLFDSAYNKIKLAAELDFWEKLYAKRCETCNTEEEREVSFLNACYEITYPRYKNDLYLTDNSFEGQRILDVGCGPSGGIIGFKNCEKYAVDHLINEYKKIGYPLDKHPIKYSNAKSEKLPYEDNFFDTVICVNALDHVDNLKKTISEIVRILKPDGKFIGQFNFHAQPNVTEPIVLEHSLLMKLFSQNSFKLKKIIFQKYMENMDEDRYYYELQKIAKKD